MVCSTTAMSALFVESRLRASHVMIGVPSPICKASRTSYRMPQNAVEAVHTYDERQLALFEVVDGCEAVGEPAGVGEHDRTNGASVDIVPHEPEPVLARRTEQVQDQVLVEGDPAEVHRHSGRGLVGEVGEIVD